MQIVIATRREKLPTAILLGVIGVWMAVKVIFGIPIFVRGPLRQFTSHSLSLIPFALVFAAYLLFGISAAALSIFAVRVNFPRTVDGTIDAVRRYTSRGYSMIELSILSERYRMSASKLGKLRPEDWLGKQARLSVGPLRMIYSLQLQD